MKYSVSFQNGSIGFVVFTVFGFLVAGSVFLATFITTQKAKTPNTPANLRLSAPPIPTRAPLQPLFNPTPAPVISPPSAATEAAIPALTAPATTNPIPEL